MGELKCVMLTKKFVNLYWRKSNQEQTTIRYSSMQVDIAIMEHSYLVREITIFQVMNERSITLKSDEKEKENENEYEQKYLE